MTDSRFPHECWLTPHATVGASPIHGLGLFATRPITATDIVMRLGGHVINDETLAGLTPPYSSLTVAAHAHLLIDPAHPVRYGNHSCDPTLWHHDATTIAARRDIEVGEELTIDYATHTGIETWAMPCHCGSALCRGRVTGNDWRLPQLQQAYRNHWVPPLLDRIDAQHSRRAGDQANPGNRTRA